MGAGFWAFRQKDFREAIQAITMEVCIINRQSHYRLFFILAKKVYSRKEHTKMSKIAKFGCEML
jgi:hypothetical protein